MLKVKGFLEIKNMIVSQLNDKIAELKILPALFQKILQI